MPQISFTIGFSSAAFFAETRLMASKIMLGKMTFKNGI